MNMRKTIHIRDGQLNTKFCEPYIVHDELPWFNPVANREEIRKRTIGISFSNTGDIIITQAICSPNDVYSPKTGRHKVLGRIIQMLSLLFSTDEDISDSYYKNHTFYFSTIDSLKDAQRLIDGAFASLYSSHTYMELPRMFNVKYIEKLYDEYLDSFKDVEEEEEVVLQVSSCRS